MPAGISCLSRSTTCASNREAITPNIDALAAQSTRYTNAYAAVPVCVGSRTTVMTGLKPSTHGVGLTVFNLNGYDELFADPNTPTLPGAMSDAGYFTATTGKLTHKPHPDRWDVAEPYPEIYLLLRSAWRPGARRHLPGGHGAGARRNPPRPGDGGLGA
ncbi:MAG: sulfatase-like hydrolase/transferase [Halioglobus sp.]|nr:sulfatase-like hydrolase/transferase [Halioglobus sp.]